MAAYNTLIVHDRNNNNNNNNNSNNNNNNNNNKNKTISSFEKPIVLLVCKPLNLILSQINLHTSARPL